MKNPYNKISGKNRLGIIIFFLINGSAFPAETVFPGGSLADLKDLSPTLTFEDLTITGPLILPAGGSTTVLHVDSLTIAETGRVGYSYSTCTYLPAPDLTVNASGQVTVNGEINLVGRSGTRTTATASCNQCYGEPGGELRITAENIMIAADIDCHGGAGSTSVSENCTSGCSAGRSGGIQLQGTNISISNAMLESYGGNGGPGTCYGFPSPGSDGAPGQIVILASNQFTMHQSIVSTDGSVTLSAAETDIFGPILANSFDANLGSGIDAEGPEVDVLAPLPGSTLSIDQGIEIQILANDTGVGVKEIEVKGLGYSGIHTADEMQNGILTFTIEKPLAPAALEVTVWDNLGNSTTTSVEGLSLISDLVVPEGETLEIIGDLDLGPAISITVSGTVIIKRGANPKISAKSLQVTPEGIIKDAELGRWESSQIKAPSLDIVLRGPASIDGILDLSGNKNGDYDTEDGGDISIQAAGISVTGTINSNGSRSVRDRGGHGGTIVLNSSLSLQISGSISSKGGHSSFSWGGSGGPISMEYITHGNLDGSSMDVSGGIGWIGGDAASGSIQCVYLGGPDPASIVAVNEVEPNGLIADAQEVLVPVLVNGSVTPGEVVDLYLGDDVYEDLFLLKLTNPLAISVELVPGSPGSNLDLLVIQADDYTILGYGLEGAGITENIPSLKLQPDRYVVMVSHVGEVPPDGSPYRLSIRPTTGTDSDADGLSDWWEEANFQGLEHDGTQNADEDGLSDFREYTNGTHPLRPDTDGDGTPDGWEVLYGYDPLVNNLIGLSLQVQWGPSTLPSALLIQGYPGQPITLQKSVNLGTWEDMTTTTGTGFFKEYSIPQSVPGSSSFFRVTSP